MTRCKKDDLAYIVVPPDFRRTLDGKFVNVGVAGECDLGTFPCIGIASWLCEFHVPWFCDRAGIYVRKCWLRDDWLRPITPPGLTEEVTEEIEVTL